MKIRHFKDEDLDHVLDITIRAFTPIHQSFQNILGDKIFDLIYPDWKSGYRDYFNYLSNEEKQRFLVAEDENTKFLMPFSCRVTSRSTRPQMLFW